VNQSVAVRSLAATLLAVMAGCGGSGPSVPLSSDGARGFSTTRALATTMNRPGVLRYSTVASGCPKDVIYVLSTGTEGFDSILIYPLAGENQQSCGVIGTFAGDAIAVDLQRNLYVVEDETIDGQTVVFKYAPGSGSPILTISDPAGPTSVSISPTGLIAVTNGGSVGPGSISLFNANGSPLGTFRDSTFATELDCKFAPNGDLFTRGTDASGNAHVNVFVPPSYAATDLNNISLHSPYGGLDFAYGYLLVGDSSTNTISAYWEGLGRAIAWAPPEPGTTLETFQVAELIGGFPTYVVSSDPTIGGNVTAYPFGRSNAISVLPGENELSEPYSIAITRRF
jgi:hypothetical protein